MSKTWKIAIALFVISLISWFVGIVVMPPRLEAIIAIVAIASSVLFVCFVAVSIMKQIKPDVSGYAVFACADIVIGIGAVLYAVYDILTDTGWFAGILGMLILIFVVPVIAVLLIIDFILYIINKKNRQKKAEIGR